MNILRFIQVVRNSFKGAEFCYLNGSCYRFYLILKEVFPEAIAYYDGDHVITRIDDRYYDITGQVERKNHLPVENHDKLKRFKFKIEIVDANALKLAVKASNEAIKLSSRINNENTTE
jgi:hypothetical protein